MRLHIRGKHTDIAPELLGRIAERLEDLNTPDEDIFEARVTLVKRAPSSGRRNTVYVQLMLSGQTLHISHDGDTIEEAVRAALIVAESRLCDFRTAPPELRKPPRLNGKPVVPMAPSLAATHDSRACHVFTRHNSGRSFRP